MKPLPPSRRLSPQPLSWAAWGVWCALLTWVMVGLTRPDARAAESAAPAAHPLPLSARAAEMLRAEVSHAEDAPQKRQVARATSAGVPRAIAGSTLREFRTAAPGTDDRIIFEALFLRLASLEPSNAVGHLDAVTHDDTRGWAERVLLIYWSEIDAPAAVGWAAGRLPPESPVRFDVARELVRRSPRAVRLWLRGLPHSPELERIAEAALRALPDPRAEAETGAPGDERWRELARRLTPSQPATP